MKSLTTDEIGLNEALAEAKITAVETDLAELIVQLAGEHSSHILVPAIHKNRSEIRTLFQHTLEGNEDISDAPSALAEAARNHLCGGIGGQWAHVFDASSRSHNSYGG